MDARERLRQYLEQRRELGEQDLLLDRLEVDDVLRMVGALAAGDSREAASGPAEERVGGPAAKHPGQPPVAGRESPSPELSPPAHAAPDQPESSGPATPTAPADSLGDWRETLRAAGGGPPGPATTPAMRSAAGLGEGDALTRTGRSGITGAARSGNADDGARLPSWIAEVGVPAGLSVGASSLRDDTFTRLTSMSDVARSVEKCTRCALYRTATHSVPGDGNPAADFVCVGEAPGANEDATGHAFVGTAGELLTKILAAINLSREDVFICNVLKHRPPANRDPAPDEVEACRPYLLRQLELVKPKVILTLGAFAAQTLLETKTPIGKLRGQVHLFHGTPLVVTYHPAALLRNPAWRRPTWEDVQLARRLLDSATRSGA